MPKKQSLQTDITIAGLPIGRLDRITPETVKVLKSARVILDLTGNESLMKKFCAKVINLDHEYWTGEVDEDVYTRIANLVLAQAKDGPRVVLVVDGHPGIYQDLSWDIRDRGRRRGLKVVILPAISFLDLMIAFCDIRVDASGLLLLDATSIVAYEYELYPHLDTLLLQIGWFGTSLLVDVEENKKGRFEPLVKYLCKYYPEGHVVKLIRAPISSDEKPTIIKTKISSLDRFHKKITTDMTMLIPAVGTTDEAVNEEFVRQTTNTAHLEKIARI
jgi:tetrapyrrole methylase family protein/MazG family protein